MADSPLAQFEIKTLVPLGEIGGVPLAITNSTVFMALAVGTIVLFFTQATRPASVVPGRFQTVAEMIYGMVADTVRSAAGREGMQYFPFVFSLFCFVLVLNLLGMIPGGFTVTSHIIVTFALAAVVFLSVLVIGFSRHGAHFLDLFVPQGAPPGLKQFLIVIELISFLSRPISLSVRLFANMLAGHIAMKVFAGFVVSLLGAGAFAVLAPLPVLIIVALTALEFLVAALQAYVFTILTCIYLNDALHPGH